MHRTESCLPTGPLPVVVLVERWQNRERREGKVRKGVETRVSPIFPGGRQVLQSSTLKVTETILLLDRDAYGGEERVRKKKQVAARGPGKGFGK